MECHLVSMRQVSGTRLYAFDCVCADRSRTPVTVQADVALARKHEIRIQELPLLCCQLLAALSETGLQPEVTLTEDQMKAIQSAAHLRAATKPHKHPRTTPAAGQAWRKMPL